MGRWEEFAVCRSLGEKRRLTPKKRGRTHKEKRSARSRRREGEEGGFLCVMSL